MYTKQAFEVDPHLRMQNTSKPGGLTPITLAVWVCAADKVRPPPIVSQNIPPASQIVRQTSHVRTTSIVDF